jgi:hypothetical protein
MLFILEQSVAAIDMPYFVDNFFTGKLKEYDDKNSTKEQRFLKIYDQAKFLSEEERKIFHSEVALLLYLLKHARPDILAVIC